MSSMHIMPDGPPFNESEALAAFGAMVRRRRRSMGLSQTTVSRLAGVDQPCWSRIEAGRYPSLTLAQALRIQRALQAPSLEELFGPSATASLLQIETGASRDD